MDIKLPSPDGSAIRPYPSKIGNPWAKEDILHKLRRRFPSARDRRPACGPDEIKMSSLTIERRRSALRA
jgi:hypothetical protein